ncbi:MAG: tetratricopeptide repeat protein [Akkermansiaceae bacterium]
MAFFIFIVPIGLLYGHGDLHHVIKALDTQIKAAPSDANLFLQRASYHRKHGDFRQALRDAKHAKTLQPKLIDHQLLCARIHADQKDWTRAKAALDSYLTARPKNATGLAFRSKINSLLGKNGAAIKDIKMAIHVHERAPLPLYLQHVDFLLENKNVDTALAVFAQAEKSLGSLPTLLTSKARMLRDYNRPTEASRVYTTLRNTNTKLAYIWWREEAEMWKKHDQKKAKQAILEAKQAWSDLPARTKKLPHMRQQYQNMLSK